MPMRLDDARPGMVLAADVKDRRGRLLLTAGREVTVHALRIFKIWGVTEVEVVGCEPPAAADDGPADLVRLEAARAHLAECFRYADRAHPAIVELFDLAARRLAHHEDDGGTAE